MRKSVVAACALTAALLVAGGGVARAQPNLPPPPTPPQSQSQAPAKKWKATPLNLHEGSSNFANVGRARMRAGDCDGAIDAFDAALETSLDASIHRDRGICHEKLGHPYPAIDDYQEYLTANNDAPDADDIRLRLRRLQDQVSGRSSSEEEEGGGGTATTGGGGAQGSTSGSAGNANASATAKVEVKTPTTYGPREPRDDRGFLEVALRAGYALPFGNLAGGQGSTGVNNLFNGAIPLWVDLGYRMMSPNLFIGAFFQYAFAIINSGNGSFGQSCSANGVNCTGSIIVVGAEAHYHFLPEGTFDPWVGAGLGWEFVNLNASQGSVSEGLGFSGVQFLNLQVGGDYRVLPQLGIGPFAAGSLGVYSDCGFTGTVSSCSIQDKAVHGWVTLGVRGVYDAGF